MYNIKTKFKIIIGHHANRRAFPLEGAQQGHENSVTDLLLQNHSFMFGVFIYILKGLPIYDVHSFDDYLTFIILAWQNNARYKQFYTGRNTTTYPVMGCIKIAPHI